mmetsp:Transcript_10456/g.20036  ORF Transcript_10456/g.20036 Transcript_10456/m.20036 type:complete len:102 (-) Transcript_10456:193-498(-)
MLLTSGISEMRVREALFAYLESRSLINFVALFVPLWAVAMSEDETRDFVFLDTRWVRLVLGSFPFEVSMIARGELRDPREAPDRSAADADEIVEGPNIFPT